MKHQIELENFPNKTDNKKESLPISEDGIVSEFQNQLNQKEIIAGSMAYINRKLLHIILLFMAIVAVFSFINNDNIVLALVTSVCAIIITEIVLIFIIKKQLSTGKAATYKLYNDFLKVVSSSGVSSTYKYNQIQSIGAKEIIVLCLAKGRFAIIAKRHLSAEQIQFFLSGMKARR